MSRYQRDLLTSQFPFLGGGCLKGEKENNVEYRRFKGEASARKNERNERKRTGAKKGDNYCVDEKGKSGGKKGCY